jgi:ribosomal 30S subunit maturation factor RimM
MDRRRRENYQVKFEDIDDPQSASQLSSKELFMSKQEIMEVIIPAYTITHRSY